MRCVHHHHTATGVSVDLGLEGEMYELEVSKVEVGGIKLDYCFFDVGLYVLNWRFRGYSKQSQTQWPFPKKD